DRARGNPPGPGRTARPSRFACEGGGVLMKKIAKFILPVLAVAMLSLAIFHVVKAQQTPTKPPPPVEPARTPFGRTVAGAGIVEAETENISIGSPLPGVVWEVYVPVDKVGQIVKPGEPLFRVDTRQLEAQRD